MTDTAVQSPKRTASPAPLDQCRSPKRAASATPTEIIHEPQSHLSSSFYLDDPDRMAPTMSAPPPFISSVHMLITYRIDNQVWTKLLALAQLDPAELAAVTYFHQHFHLQTFTVHLKALDSNYAAQCAHLDALLSALRRAETLEAFMTHNKELQNIHLKLFNLTLHYASVA